MTGPSVQPDHEDVVALAAFCKNAYYAARDGGGTMHTAADDAARAILTSSWFADVKADAWDEGYEVSIDDTALRSSPPGPNGPPDPTPNPYRVDRPTGPYGACRP
jgi:hypothetical protein